MHWVVRVPIGKLGNHVLEGVEHVEVGAGIEIGRGKRRSGMQQIQLAYAGFFGMLLPQQLFELLGDVHNLALLVGFNGKTMHLSTSALHPNRLWRRFGNDWRKTRRASRAAGPPQ